MSKPTPAPWTVVPSLLIRDGRPSHYYVEPASLGCAVASVIKTEADARLIASAPELLAGLIQAVDQLEQDYGPTPLDGHAALIRKLRAIISKAADIPVDCDKCADCANRGGAA